MSLWTRISERRSYFLVSAVVLVLDQATKILAHAYLPDRGMVEIVPGIFNLWYSRNPGGLFGYFRDWADPWRTLLLTLLPMAAIVMIGRFLVRSPNEGRSTLLGLGLILGGATGNLIDRLTRGDVVDFLDVYVSHQALADQLVSWFGTAHWPTFNVADSAIVVGAALLLLSLLRPQLRTPAPETSGPPL